MLSKVNNGEIKFDQSERQAVRNRSLALIFYHNSTACIKAAFIFTCKCKKKDARITRTCDLKVQLSKKPLGLLFSLVALIPAT
jgi:hypothetical protein